MNGAIHSGRCSRRQDSSRASGSRRIGRSSCGTWRQGSDPHRAWGWVSLWVLARQDASRLGVEDGTIRLWDVAEDRSVPPCWAGRRPARSCSRRQQALASACSWFGRSAVGRGSRRGAPDPSLGMTWSARCVLSPDRTLLPPRGWGRDLIQAVGREDGCVPPPHRAWGIGRGWTYRGFSPQGGTPDGHVVGQPATGEERTTLTGHRDSVYSGATSPDSRLLASGQRTGRCCGHSAGARE